MPDNKYNNDENSADREKMNEHPDTAVNQQTEAAQEIQKEHQPRQEEQGVQANQGTYQYIHPSVGQQTFAGYGQSAPNEEHNPYQNGNYVQYGQQMNVGQNPYTAPNYPNQTVNDSSGSVNYRAEQNHSRGYESQQNRPQNFEASNHGYPNYYETGNTNHFGSQYRHNGTYSTNDTASQYEQDAKLKALVKAEVARVKPRNVWLKALAIFLVGTILGMGGTFGLWRMGVIKPHDSAHAGTPQSTQPQNQEVSQGAEKVHISLNEDSTVENAVAKKAIPSIVGITALVKGQENPFYFYNEVPQYAEAVGSGIIVDANGYILTNSHVINNGDTEKLTVSFDNDESVEAKIIWNDQTLDLAIIKVDKSNLPVAEIGDSDAVQVGDKAIAVGNPLGLDLQSTLTSGYISGLNRTIYMEGGNIMDGLIQTDAAINSGNSGGALLNAKGEVIGINTARPRTADGIGFAIPINDLKPIIQKVIAEGSYQSLYIGITGNNAQLYARMSKQELPTDKGVVINQVMPHSPAEKAQLKPGDIITAIDGQEIDSMNSLKTQLLHFEIGDQATLTILRDGQEQSVEIEFVEFDLPETQS